MWADGVCPNIREKVRVIIKDSRTCHAYLSGRGEYEIQDGRIVLPISLTNRTCICGRWQISGIPCKHGVRAILVARKEPLDYVSEWFLVLRYKETYRGNISPIPDQEQWPEMDLPKLTPFAMKRGIGIPSKIEEGRKEINKIGKEAQQFNAKNAELLGTTPKPVKEVQLLGRSESNKEVNYNKKRETGKKGRVLARGNISQDEAMIIISLTS
ncbi:uncharacterized protein LOC104883617 [Beta vulgaris subsp. vulgaris]|uniref:uncharacterized protein LOC104883617 n=1 Tax=Beta vulgaris subsp. vulgaris TaxID=3555 RepID=UPI00053FFC76|nr:uncharacterized protein LOC104883617 [Beta vulgaris subsp. vulgaris]